MIAEQQKLENASRWPDMNTLSRKVRGCAALLHRK
jgi:hypothetical protein